MVERPERPTATWPLGQVKPCLALRPTRDRMEIGLRESSGQKDIYNLSLKTTSTYSKVLTQPQPQEVYYCRVTPSIYLPLLLVKVQTNK